MDPQSPFRFCGFHEIPGWDPNHDLQPQMEILDASVSIRGSLREALFVIWKSWTLPWFTPGCPVVVETRVEILSFGNPAAQRPWLETR